jgi:hypothetical protein
MSLDSAYDGTTRKGESSMETMITTVFRGMAVHEEGENHED